MNKSIFSLLIFIFFLSCEKKEKTDNSIAETPQIIEGNAYGSTFKIVYYSHGKDLNPEIEKIMQEFDASVNTYIEDSHLSRFNQSKKGSFADPMMIELFDLSRQLNTKTNGFFDPSVAGLSVLWGFSKEGAKNAPTQIQVDSVLKFTGLQHAQLLNDSLIKKHPSFSLNFNAITGYVNDKIGQYLDSRKVDNYLIEIGGELLAKGIKPDSTYWSVGIDKPVENAEQQLFATLNLKNEALATSGNYRKFYLDEQGRKIVHTINPKTGMPQTTTLLSATVIAKTCAEADATATALMAMGLEKAQEYVSNRTDLKFFLIWSDDVGEYQSKTYNGFEANLID
ncbi:MAG: FAD:protein FMN transferase [Flavobacteriaceae bacterium]|nr:FAD:protein FMN transferase [Flavobacteriaceae bacterium]